MYNNWTHSLIVAVRTWWSQPSRLARLAYIYNKQHYYTYKQGCESWSGGIRNFFPDPELFRSDPDPVRMKEQINTYIGTVVNRYRYQYLKKFLRINFSPVWNRKWQIVGEFFFLIENKIFLIFFFSNMLK